MTSLLRAALDRAADPTPAVAADTLRRFPPVEVEVLVRAGLLAPLPPAAAVGCDSCGDDHVEPVVWADTPDGPPRAFLWCPADGRVRVPAERLGRWAVRAEAAGGALTGLEPVSRVPGRVWHLGPLAGGWVGWLVAGWRGVSGLAERVPELSHPTAAVFVPHTLPPAGVWGRSAPPRVIPLSAVLTPSADRGLAADPVALAAYLGPPDDPPGEPVVTTTDPAGGPPVPLPAGTRWEDVAVEVDDHHLLVRTAGGEWRVGYEDAGFGDGRNGTPGQRWALLRLLAKRGGELDDGDGKRTKSDKLTRAVSDLRAALCRLTGLTADPFHPTRRTQPYRTRFRVRTTLARPSDG